MFDALYRYGWTDRWAALFASLDRDDIDPGRVVRHDGMLVNVVGPNGEIAALPVHTSVQPQPVVGDWVVTTDAVVDVLPRASLLRRQDPDGGEQPLVANLDVLVLVNGLDRPVKAGRIQRGIILAWDAGATPLVVLTKADLVDAGDVAATVAALEQADAGADVLVVSGTTGDGIDELRSRCAGRTIVLLGESGAGKSTLTNALVRDEVADTGPVRTGDSKGRHTTSSRQIHLLSDGGVLVDTPGIRGVGLWIDEEASAAIFDDVEALAEGCRFSDCQHEGQPGCAIAEALASGELANPRFEAWRLVQREQTAMARKSDPHARHSHERKFGRLVQEAAKLKRPGQDQG